jgi:pimeloyl-ACP methyl ester carboxylesterase
MSNQARILTRSGTPIHYWLTDGSASKPLILFTHGAGCDHRMFDEQVRALSGKYRILTWDARGHGLSRPIGDAFSLRIVVDDLLAILDQLGVQKAIFAGQSMGGNVAQEVCFHYPDRVHAMLLIDCVCNTNALSAVERWALKLTPAILKLYPYDTLLRQSAKVASIKPDVQEYIYETMKMIPKEDIVTILQETTGALHPDPDYRIPKPFLLVRGDHDNAGAIKKQGPIWAAREPNCKYVVIPDAGHNSNQDNPAEFNRVMFDYLASLNL